MIKGTGSIIKTGDTVFLNKKLHEQCTAMGTRYNEPFNTQMNVVDVIGEIAEVEFIERKEVRDKNGKAISKEEIGRKIYRTEFLSHKNELAK